MNYELTINPRCKIWKDERKDTVTENLWMKYFNIKQQENYAREQVEL